MRRPLASAGWGALLAVPLAIVAVVGAADAGGAAWVALHACAAAGAAAASLPAALALALAASMATLAGWHGVRQALLGRRLLGDARAAAAPVPPGTADLAARLGIRRLIVTELPDDLAFCTGFLRPAVVVSRRLIERLPPEALAAVLAHEAAHARGRDPLHQVLAHSAARGLWPVPLVAALAAHQRLRHELAADRAAVRHAGLRPLAAALLALHEPASFPAAPGVAGGASLLSQRMDALEGDARMPALRLGPSVVLRTAAGLTLMVALLAGVVLGPAVGPDPLMPMPMAGEDLAGMLLAWGARLLAAAGALAVVGLARGGMPGLRRAGP